MSILVEMPGHKTGEDLLWIAAAVLLLGLVNILDPGPLRALAVVFLWLNF